MLAAVETIALPGIGLVVVGRIAAAVAGGAAGAAGGGIIGGLIRYGIPDDRATLYESGIREGNIITGVSHARERTRSTSTGSDGAARAEPIYRATWGDAA